MTPMERRDTIAAQVKSAAPAGWTVYTQGSVSVLPAVAVNYPGEIRFHTTTATCAFDLTIDVLVPSANVDKAYRDAHEAIAWIADLIGPSVKSVDRAVSEEAGTTNALRFRINLSQQEYNR